ncbi:hypothetical protein V6N13_134640 [Hibiscus sabdariffa]
MMMTIHRDSSNPTTSSLFFGEGSMYSENCTSLQYVFLYGNGPSGTFLENLFRLQLCRAAPSTNISFQGLSYGIGNLSNLVELDISLNGFVGRVPDVFEGLRMQESFSSGSNGLTGLLPVYLVNSASLSGIDLHNNSLDSLIRIKLF